MNYLPPNRRGNASARPGVDCGCIADVRRLWWRGHRWRRFEGSVAADEEIAVTLITKTSTNPFFIAMQKGAEEAGKANNVTITTAAGKEDGDEATQIQAIEAATARGDAGF